MLNNFILIYSWLIRTILFFLPDAPLIMRFRGVLYSLLMKRSGKNLQVSATAVLNGLRNITTGDNVYIAHNVYVGARAEIIIGNNVLIGINTVIMSGNHTYSNGSYRFGKPAIKQIKIGNGVWIASNSTVTAGSVIGDSTLIGPCNSVHGTYDTHGLYLNEKPINKKKS